MRTEECTKAGSQRPVDIELSNNLASFKSEFYLNRAAIGEANLKKIYDIDLGYKRFRGEKIDEDYERVCEITIHKLKQDFNIWGSEVQKKEEAYEEEKYAAACRYMLSIPFVDEDDYIPKAITPDLPSKEPEDSLIMVDEHLDTIRKTDRLSAPPSLFPLRDSDHFMEEDRHVLASYDSTPPGGEK
ncbi:hypothetical protein Tco_0588268 [Tanacetum coccineum]